MLNINEEWKTVEDFPNYKVSNLGRIKNKHKILKTYVINSGYLCIKLHNENGRKSFLVHRLVAQLFINNESNHSEVNHIDGNKDNNCASNLEWVTSSTNKKHALNTGLKVYNKPTTGLKHKSSASKYHNVGKSRNKWIATVRYKGKNWYQKRFDNEEDAARHVNWILDTLGLNDRPRNIID